MSNPLKRRMAKAALVVAAGAAPVFAAGGQASALSLPEATPDLDSLTQLDEAVVEHTLDNASRAATDLGNGLGGEVVKQTAPIVAPALERTATETAYTTGTLLHGAATRLAENGLSPDEIAAIFPTLDNPDLHGLTL
ncbi:ATP-binding protein [Streptomyces sp. 7-21]|jgi:hypothetical protein|uniref:ATP-binding protein n=1 Tax=Streptomyces sp. 7-21 TaxID=2802283 RepID=UPI00191F6106|nr:ATP-binding protein [Streptomyces sp. 7-21]MBL1066282.1 ATP-binding protein [Streptomyces sp. 7-21]